MFLFGAGVSVPAGLPGSNQLTKDLEDFFGEPQQRDLLRAFRFVVSCVQQHYAKTDRSPLSSVNIEDVIELVRFIQERKTDKISTVVSKWHDELDVRSNNGEKIKNLFKSHISPLGAQIGREIERKSKDAEYTVKELFDKIAEELPIIREQLEIDDDLVFQDIHRATLNFVIGRLATVSIENLGYLFETLKFAAETKSDIVTLNYDRAVEVSCANQEFQWFDGFDKTTQVYQQRWRGENEDGINLIKLHGSLDWEERPVDKTTGRPIAPTEIYFKGRKIDYVNLCKVGQPYVNSALMFAETFKFRPLRFYVDLYSQFFKALDRAQEIVVSGYSFQDSHINFHIERWLTEDGSRKVFIFNRAGFVLPEHLMRTNQYVIKDLGISDLTGELLRQLRN